MSQQIVSKPVGWQETVGGVKQACWCGEQWSDTHEDGNHAEAEVQVPVLPVLPVLPALPVLGKRKAEEVETHEGGESEEELEEGWQKGWYGPVRCEE